MSYQNRYELRDKLGAGGMGAVYTARDRLTGNIIALKRVLIPAEKASDESAADLLTAIATEFRTLAGLRHPHVMRVMDYGFTLEGSTPQPYFTMDYLPGARTLTNAAADQPPEVQVRLLTEMLLALAYLHRRGVIHRDLKPDNVLVDNSGQVKVLDFGLALGVTGKSTSGLTEGAAGTMAYMAPELFADENATVRSDLYAAGMLIYEVFTGTYPFNRKNMMLLLNDIVNTTPDVSHLAFDLGDLVERLLAKDPAQRPGDANIVIRELRAATHQPVLAESIIIRESFLQASRFVGRTAEMEQLKTALDNTLNGPPAQMYLIGGESGVGKSRLLDELRTRALVKGAMVLRGQGVAEGGLPYQLWREMARELLLSTTLSDLEASILKEIVSNIGTLLHRDVADAPELTGSAGQQRLVLTLVDLLKRQKGPVVLLLEDLQWAQESLAPVTQMLAVQEQLPRLLVIGTYRDDERPDLPAEFPGAQRVKLSRFDDAAMADLTQSMLGEVGTQPEILNLLKRETEGNAFFMVETVRALAEEAGTLGNIGRSTLPRQVFAGGIQQIVRRRLSRVPDNVRPLLNRAAIAGRLLDLNVLQNLADHDLNAFLTGGAGAGVLEIVEERWRFAHDKLRETLLNDLSDMERRDLHRAVANAIETAYPDNESYHETLMEHWRAAGDVAKELHYLVLVVWYLVEIRADYTRAIQLAERGLTLSDAQSAYLPKLLNLLSQVYRRQGAYATAHQWAQQAQTSATRLENHQEIIKSMQNLGILAMEAGNYGAAIDYFQQCLARSHDIKDVRSIAEGLNLLGVVAANQGNAVAAKEYYQQSLTHYQALGDQPGIVIALSNVGAALSLLGDNAAIDYIQQSLALSREIGDRWGVGMSLENLGIETLAQGGDTTTAKNYYQQSLVIWHEIGNRRGIASALHNIGSVARREGDYATARDYYLQGLTIRRDIEDLQGAASSLNSLGFAASLQGDTTAARDYYQQSLAIARQIGDQWNTTNTLNNLGFVALMEGDLITASTQFGEALALGHEARILPFMLESIVGLARLRAQANKIIYAAELVGFVDPHPAVDASLRDGELANLRRKLEALMPADELAAAMERGKILDLETTVKKLLAETTP